MPVRMSAKTGYVYGLWPCFQAQRVHPVSEHHPEAWKPDRVIAILLGLLFQYVGMLYVARVGWAAVYLLLTLAILAFEFHFSAPWLSFFSLSKLLAVVCVVHAYRAAVSFSPVSKRPGYSRWYGLIGVYFSLLTVSFLFRAFLYEPYRLPSGSMQPTIDIGSYVWVSKYGYGHYGADGITLARTAMSAELLRGDVVVVEYPPGSATTYVKRVVGIGGDKVGLVDGQLLINGRTVQVAVGDKAVTVNDKGLYLLKEESLDGVRYQVQYLEGSVRESTSVILPPRTCFVLGDNRDSSRDSRDWGFIPQESVIGKVVFVSH